VFRLVRFEIEIQRNQRPAPIIAVSQSLLDDGPDALEEVLLHRRFRTVGRLPMAHDGSRLACGFIGVPQQILFDRDWNAGA
jgi:hypothetical protein